jgi:hypothetical protein
MFEFRQVLKLTEHITSNEPNATVSLTQWELEPIICNHE